MDANIRVKANVEGVTAKNYCGGSVSSLVEKRVDNEIENEYLGRSKTFVINSVYNNFQTGKEIPLENLFEIHKDYPPYKDTLFKSSNFRPNEFIEVYDSTKIEVGRKLSKPIGGRFDSSIKRIVPLVYVKKFLKTKKKLKDVSLIPKNIGQEFALDALLAPPDIAPLVIIKGAAGTAKTFLTIAVAIDGIQRGNYKKIIITRPNVEMDKDIGFIPGKEEEKMEPYIRSFKDNLEVLFPASEYPDRVIQEYLSGKRGPITLKKISYGEAFFYDDFIKLEALSFLRGRSLANTFLIVDEAQNCTPSQALAITTRAANGTKIVLLGDPAQVDREGFDAKNNGLGYIFDLVKDSALCWQITLTSDEGTRSPLVTEIEQLAKEKELLEKS